jgi:pre-mRNA-splicing helicase BRR2
MMGRANIT